MADFFNAILPPLQIAAATAGVALLGYLGVKLAQLIQGGVKNVYLANVLTRVSTAVMTAVKATAQTYTDALKAKAADGKLTPEEQQEAFVEAMEKAKSYVSLTEIMKAFGLASEQHAEMFLADKVEAAVKDLKAAPSPDPKA